MVKGLTPGFFAREDTVTPVKIGLLAVAVNLVLNVILMGPLLHIGIAARYFSVCVVKCGFTDHRSPSARPFCGRRRSQPVPRMVIAGTLLGVALLVSQGQMELLLAGLLPERILGLAGLVVVGLIVYGILALMMRIATVDDLRRALNRRPASA